MISLANNQWQGKYIYMIYFTENAAMNDVKKAYWI